MNLWSRLLPVATIALAGLSTSVAAAAPVTVTLRVEGPASTLFEGPVTTDVAPWKFSDQPTEWECDGTPESNTGGTSPVPAVTRGAVLATAARQHGFSLKGSFDPAYGSPVITEVAGQAVGWDDATQRYLVEYRNWRASDLGACAETVAPGDEVLFGHAGYGSVALRLTGPGQARPGEPFVVRVTDGDGNGVAGASVAGASTDGAGNARVTLTSRGTQAVKAEKAGAVRSNALSVCVSDGADGYCGNPTPTGQVFQPAESGATPFVPDRTAPRARVASLKRGQRISRRRAPRVLRGKVDEAGGVLMVKIKLTRTYKGRCTAYSARRERWIRRPKCGAQYGWWFRVGDKAEWEYQLPRRLPRGRYVLDVNAIDRSYNRDDARRPGENRVVFHVV
jgi:hypothetical protein